MQIHTRRVYAPPEPDDGQRILVDRIWPRGLSRDQAALDAWLKDLAPSTELRRWFGHDPQRWDGFCRRYRAELEQRPQALAELRLWLDAGPVTLLFAARDTEYNNAVALRAYLLDQEDA